MRPAALTLIKIAAYVLLDCGAYTLWRKGIPYEFDAVCAWYRTALSVRPCPQVWLAVLIPDVIGGGERENDDLVERFPADLAPYAWPVWHTEESIDRLLCLVDRFGRVAVGAMGRQREVTGAAYTERMVEVFNIVPSTAQIHMLRGLRLSGGPFPFSAADSTDAGRNWSQTPSRLQFCLDRWDRRARLTAKSWDHKAAGQPFAYREIRQVTLTDHLWSKREAA